MVFVCVFAIAELYTEITVYTLNKHYWLLIITSVRDSRESFFVRSVILWDVKVFVGPKPSSR